MPENVPDINKILTCITFIRITKHSIQGRAKFFCKLIPCLNPFVKFPVIIRIFLVIEEKLETSVAFLSGKTNDISSDIVSIYKDSDPLLFELIKSTQNADNATLQRLITYYHQLTKND